MAKIEKPTYADECDFGKWMGDRGYVSSGRHWFEHVEYTLSMRHLCSVVVRIDRTTKGDFKRMSIQITLPDTHFYCKDDRLYLDKNEFGKPTKTLDRNMVLRAELALEKILAEFDRLKTTIGQICSDRI